MNSPESLFETPVVGPATSAARRRRERREAARRRAQRRFAPATLARAFALTLLYVFVLGAGMLVLVTATPLSRLAFWISWPTAFVLVQGVMLAGLLVLRRLRAG